MFHELFHGKKFLEKILHLIFYMWMCNGMSDRVAYGKINTPVTYDRYRLPRSIYCVAVLVIQQTSTPIEISLHLTSSRFQIQLHFGHQLITLKKFNWSAEFRSTALLFRHEFWQKCIVIVRINSSRLRILQGFQNWTNFLWSRSWRSWKHRFIRLFFIVWD